jgi:formate/nitrite transporter FocA (FNT family)
MKKGFVMVAVMLILFLMGTEFFVLNSTSNLIAIETNNALVQADKQNLILSGLALVQTGNFKNGEVISPDITALAGRDSKMSIKIENGGQAEINILCKRGMRELTSVKKYDISR